MTVVRSERGSNATAEVRVVLVGTATRRGESVGVAQHSFYVFASIVLFFALADVQRSLLLIDLGKGDTLITAERHSIVVGDDVLPMTFLPCRHHLCGSVIEFLFGGDFMKMAMVSSGVTGDDLFIFPIIRGATVDGGDRANVTGMGRKAMVKREATRLFAQTARSLTKIERLRGIFFIKSYIGGECDIRGLVAFP